MIGLIQRVQEAQVSIDKETFSSIKKGIVLLLGIEKKDTPEHVDKLVKKVLNYRLFEDEQGKMNLNLSQVQGELLVVSQFTLAADTKAGLRPSFSSAAPPEQARELYTSFVEQAKIQGAVVKTGSFGADMKVHLINDGPVTFSLNV